MAGEVNAPDAASACSYEASVSLNRALLEKLAAVEKRLEELEQLNLSKDREKNAPLDEVKKEPVRVTLVPLPNFVSILFDLVPNSRDRRKPTGR